MFAKEIKALTTYSLTGVVDTSPLEQEIPLWQYFHECQDDEREKLGFVPFKGEEDTEYLVERFAGLEVIKLGYSKKKIPAKEVKKLLSQALVERKKLFLENNPAEEEYKISKEEKEDLKEEIITELLPKCFSEESFHYVIIDTQENKLYITNGKGKFAEGVTQFLRSAIGSLSVIPIVFGETTEENVSREFSRFVTSSLNTKLSLGNFVELKSEEGTVTWKKESLYESEATKLIEEDGKEVVKLQLEWDGVVSFVIDNTFLLSNLKFDSATLATGGSFQADVLVVMNEIRGLIKELMKEANLIVDTKEGF